MTALTASQMLSIWDRGVASRPSARALDCLVEGFDMPGDQLALLSIGRRDRLLLDLREQTLGPRFQGFISCPACGDQLEADFEADQIRSSDHMETFRETTTETGGWSIRWRLPHSDDLMGLSASGRPFETRAALLGRCIREIRYAGRLGELDELPSEVIDRVVEEMSRTDPQGDVRLWLRCPACGQEWNAIFDIAEFFWREIEVRAKQLLEEVHLLAAAHGWSEGEILAMGPGRRERYLELVR